MTILRHLLCTMIASFFLPLQASDAIPITVAHDAPFDNYHITNTVLHKNPARFSSNIVWLYSWKPWGGEMYFNIWNENFSMEPYNMREEYFISTVDSDNSATQLSYAFSKKDKKPGFSYWGSIPSGMWAGGTAVIYRDNGTLYERIHESVITSYTADTIVRKEVNTYPAHIELATPIPEQYGTLQKSDIVVLTVQLTKLDTTNEEMKQSKKWTSKLGKAFFGVHKTSDATWEIDTSSKCPEGGSTASMHVQFKDYGAMSHWYMGYDGHDGPKADVKKVRFTPGKEYKCQVWLKQKGIANKEVTIEVGHFTNKTLTVGEEWEKFEFDIPTTPENPSSQSPQLIISATGGGEFWIDNFLIYQTDLEPFQTMPYIKQAMVDLKPEYIRSIATLNRTTLNGGLLTGFQSLGFREPLKMAAGATGLSLPSLLELCEDSKANPYFALWGLYSDEEVSQLMEYLCAPADIGYGKIRAAQGRPEPWINSFDRFVIECHNESWNNNQRFNIAGSAKRPDVYGKIANRLFTLIKQSPYYQADKFVCALNGKFLDPYTKVNKRNKTETKGWSMIALDNCPEADMIEWGLYYRGADGVGDASGKQDKLMTDQLLYNARIVKPKMDMALQLQKYRKEKLGKDLLLSVYEAGPGYPLPDPGKTFHEDFEKVGKSLASGVVTLDAFLDNQKDGFFAINYFLLNSGYNWAAYNNFQDMVPYPSWQVLMMHNEHCDGDMLVVDTLDSKQINYATESITKITYNGKKRSVTIPGTDNIDLVRCHAYQDGPKRSIILLNRSYTETRDVHITCDWAVSPTAELYTLTNESPSAHNLHEQQVFIKKHDITDFSQNYSIALPPSSVYIIVNRQE